jgi:pimeloyl-ACP methyl ester carboxylesterase
MAAMPLPFLLNRLTGLASLALLASGVWFVADWADSGARSQAWLYAGSVLVALGVFGRIPVTLLFRKQDGPSADDLPRGEIDTVMGAGGSRLHIESFGPRDGRPIVLTHAWGQDRTAWAETVRELSKRWRVIVWDLPGLGRSSRPYDGAYSLDRLAEDLRLVLLATGCRQALLVGHSIGGMAVLTLCRDRPEMLGRDVAGVALLNCGCRSPIETGAASTFLRTVEQPLLIPLCRLCVWLSPLFHLAAWAGYLNGTSQLIVRGMGFGDDPGREAIEHAALLQTRHAPSVQAKGLLAMLRWNAPRAPEMIAVPTLVVAGGRDLAVRPHAAREIADAAPMSEFVLVEPAGHAGPMEQAEAYHHALARHAEAVFARADRTARAMHADVLRRREDIPAFRPEPERPSWAPAADDEAGLTRH